DGEDQVGPLYEATALALEIEEHGGSESGSLSRGPALGYLRRRPAEELREQDTQLEEGQERQRLEDHRDRVHSRQSGRDDGADEVGVAAVLAQLLGARDPQPGRGEDHDRELEYRAARKHRGRDAVVVVARANLGVELVGV